MHRNKTLLLFFFLTFTFSWVFWTIPILIKAGVYKDADFSSLFGLGVAAPILAATAVAFIGNGKKGIKSLYSRLFIKQIPLIWYLLAAALPMLFSFFSIIVYCIITNQSEHIFDIFIPVNFISAILFLIVFAALEEVGWRGFALPKLREKHNAVLSALILGLIWGLWHLPKIISEGTTDALSIITLIIFGMLLSVFISWIYENTRGSIFLAILTHASVNASIYCISPDAMIKIGFNKMSLVYIVILCIFDISVYLYSGQNLRRKPKI
ncbi:MAG: CPBP family glutamic-type intramembrane protease [Eubacteriales bacterium]